MVALIQPFMLYLFHFGSFYLQYICVPDPPNGFFLSKQLPLIDLFHIKVQGPGFSDHNEVRPWICGQLSMFYAFQEPTNFKTKGQEVYTEVS